jgi:hypothetical protein
MADFEFLTERMVPGAHLHLQASGALDEQALPLN